MKTSPGAVFALLLGISLVSMGMARAASLQVFAAASLAEALREICGEFEAAHAGTTVDLNLAGSQVLRTQIEQGARADLFASADLAHAAALEKEDLLERPQLFARNRLVVVVPEPRPLVTDLAGLARPGIRLVVAGPAVPAGRYADQVIEKIDACGVFGDGYRAGVLANVASRESNVRAVLAKVVLGEADAGIVYSTDAAAATDRIRVLVIPDSLNVVAEYPIGILRRSEHRDLAAEFLKLVMGPTGQEILRRHGFEP